MHRLDLLNLKPDSLEVKLLLELLKKEKRPGVDHSGSVLKKNSTYKIEFKVKEYSIQLSHTLIFRARNKPTKSGFRCDIINDKLLGKGGYGELYPILKTFSVNEEFSLIGWKNTPKERVVKIQLGHPMNEESTILQSVPHIHAKRVIVYESQRENYCSEKKQHCSIVGNESYIVMKKLPGKELSSLKLESFTIEQKIQLFLKVLLALKNQVHDLDLVHKDINSDNILVEFCEKTEIFTVNIIDYGLAKKIEKGEQYNITVHPIEPPINYGTPTQDRQEYDILCLTGFSERLFCIPDSYLSKNKKVNATNLAEKHQHRLEKLIKSMFASDPESRPTIGALISEVEAIQDEMTRSNGKNVRFSSSFFQSAGLIASEESANSLFSQVKHAN